MYKHGSPGEAANLDLHWHLFKPPVVQEAETPEWFWETARPALIDETPTLTLGPEAQLLYLSTHVGEQHAEGLALGSLHSLLWLADIATVIARNAATVDWTEVLARAESYGLQAPVRAVLVHLAQEWAAPIPGPTVTALAHLRAPTRKDQTLDLLTAEAPATGQLHRSYFVTLVGLKSWSSRFQFVAHAGFPSFAYMRERYKVRRPILTPLFYLYRGFVGLRSLVLTSGIYLRQRIARAGRRAP